MYENRKQPLASREKYIKRVLRNILFSLYVIVASLLIGIAGYHYLANIPWIDALHNAAMILSGMGPVVTITNDAGKIFSTFYALFSGIVFISNVGLILAPLAHRLFHRINLEE